MTVDMMHDIPEGIWEYDSGLILNYFIAEKTFTSPDFNKRLNSFDFGPDEKRKELCKITTNQIKE